MYKRKTKDEFQLHINYGQGWEHEISTETRAEIKAHKKEYAENCPQYPTKVLKKRFPIQKQSTCDYCDHSEA